jgi:hypothetical protein
MLRVSSYTQSWDDFAFDEDRFFIVPVGLVSRVCVWGAGGGGGGLS